MKTICKLGSEQPRTRTHRLYPCGTCFLPRRKNDIGLFHLYVPRVVSLFRKHDDMSDNIVPFLTNKKYLNFRHLFLPLVVFCSCHFSSSLATPFRRPLPPLFVVPSRHFSSSFSATFRHPFLPLFVVYSRYFHRTFPSYLFRCSLTPLSVTNFNIFLG